jgi:hypothetical protein
MDRFVYCAAVLAAIVGLGNCLTAYCCGEERATELPPISDLLPADGTEVDVMGPPERFAELSKKLQGGLKENPGAFVGGVLKAKSGEPIAYDPRLGLTEEEYREFLELAQNLKFEKLGSLTLKVACTDNGVKLDGGEFLPELSKITFMLMEQHVQTPFGKCMNAAEVHASDGQKATGAWSGVQWKLEQLLPPSDVTLSLGKLKGSGRGLLIYRVRGFEGLKPKSILYVLIYDLPAAK